MAMTNASANLSFLPQDVGDLLVKPVIWESIAATISTTISTGANAFRIPIVAADPSAAWVAEGAEITPSDATLDEAVVAFKKLAGLTIVSNELINDASPEAAQIIGDGLARDIATKLDAAFFANTTSNGPSGLKSLTTSTASAGGSWANADPFTSAVFTAEGVGATIGAWVANPADGLLLSSLKEATGSNRNLLQPDPTQAGRRVIGGLPLYSSTAVTAGEVWGVPKDRVFVVIRNDVDVQVDGSVFFTSDRSAIRATMRVGFAFPHALAIVKVTKA